MNSFSRFLHRMESSKDVAFDLLRIYLGLGLLVRGLLFILQPASFVSLADSATAGWLASGFVYYYVVAAHVLGGTMLAVGFLTRLAVLVQIPILVGAVILIHLPGGLFTSSQSLEFSLLVLFLLVLVFLHGSGRWSIDHYRDVRFPPLDRLAGQLDTSSEVAFELLRVYLGVGLFVRGVLFISNADAFIELVGPTSGDLLTSLFLIHYVALSHLVGGLLLAFGLLTRLAALVQLPILAGAVFIVHFQGGLIDPSQSLEFSALVLFLLVLVLVHGSGRWSIDYYLFARTSPEPDENFRHVVLNVDRHSSPASLLSAAPATARATCTCGHDRDHPRVFTQATYSPLGAAYFLMGITGPPYEIVYRCGDCGEIVERTRTPEARQRHRYP
jgi:uncharacterized membrane protein YphA (DoxX/SURF4 family)